MRVEFRTNLGVRDASAHGLDYRECAHGMQLDIGQDAAEKLIARHLATEVVQLKAVPPLEIKASPPVAAEQPAAVPATETSTPEVPAVKQKPKGGK